MPQARNCAIFDTTRTNFVIGFLHMSLLQLIVEGSGGITRLAGVLSSTCAAQAEQGLMIRARDKLY